MITIKVKKTDELIYLIGLEQNDLQDLSIKDAVLTLKLGDQKVSLIKVSGSRDEFVEHIKTLGGINESLIIKP